MLSLDCGAQIAKWKEIRVEGEGQSELVGNLVEKFAFHREAGQICKL